MQKTVRLPFAGKGSVTGMSALLSLFVLVGDGFGCG
jgi:hypothetical protein